MNAPETILLTVLGLLCLSLPGRAVDHIVLVKTHQSFFKVMDQQEFFVSDSVLAQESKALLSHHNKLLAREHIRRIVRFDEGKVYELDLIDSTYSEMDLNEFTEECRKQLEKSEEKLQEQANIEAKLLKSRRRTTAVKKMHTAGRWRDRFNWSVDTIAFNECAETPFGAGWNCELKREGCVKAQSEDTLRAARYVTCVPGNPSLIRLGEAMADISHFSSPAEWLHWYFTKYHFHGSAGSAGAVQHLVPVGAGFDTTMTDFRLPDSGVPISSTFRIALNERERHGLVGKGNMIDFAGQSYVVKSLESEFCILADSISIVSAEQIDAMPDWCYSAPDGFDEWFFPKEEILRFFETESRIVQKEHIHSVM